MGYSYFDTEEGRDAVLLAAHSLAKIADAMSKEEVPKGTIFTLTCLNSEGDVETYAFWKKEDAMETMKKFWEDAFSDYGFAFSDDTRPEDMIAYANHENVIASFEESKAHIEDYESSCDFVIAETEFVENASSISQQEGEDKMIKLTEKGQREVHLFLAEIAEKRKEILDAVKDTADDTNLPTKEDILSDIESFGDENGYYNCWGCTDSTRYDMPISLIRGEDYIVK